MGRAFASVSLMTVTAVMACGSAKAQDDQGIQEIIVTATKRAQSANDVGLSISTVDADTLSRRKIDDPIEVARLVPALSVTPTGTSSSTVYTLRGIGFNSNFLGASPTVAVYVDEVPLTYPAMTQGAVLDLERVEVYKGPQGILFGQNSTAGAVNFIAAKPTDHFTANVSGSYGRFNRWDGQFAVSGPLSDTLKARLAVRQEGGGDWQRSYTRNASLGERDRTSARLLVDWAPADTLKVTFGLSGWRDESDTQALQLLKIVPNAPQYLIPALANYPLAPHNARAADWEPDKQFRFDTTFWQPSLRAELDLSPDVTLTSLSTYSKYKTDSLLDNDGTDLQVNSQQYTGDIEAVSQELRLSGTSSNLTWLVGASYSWDNVHNAIRQFTLHQSNTQNVSGTGFSIGEAPVTVQQKTETKAVFANLSYKPTSTLELIAGARYTAPKIEFAGCNRGQGYAPVPNTPTPGVTQDLEGLFNLLYQLFSGNAGVSPITRGGCITLNSLDGTFLPTNSEQTLKEDNFSWSLTANYKPSPDVLLYALTSRGYKAGSFPIVGAATNQQFLPARQEKVQAYELGYKLTVLDRRMQIDGAFFYYDYTDKQLSGFLKDAIFGPLLALVNVPKSRVQGTEIAVNWHATEGLVLSGGATYVDTKVKRYSGFDSTGAVRDFSGERFNLSPRWFANVDATYTAPINEQLEASANAGATYRSSTSGTIGGNDPAFDIKGYWLIDASLGIQQTGGEGWSARVWGKNIFNKYYWSNANFTSDTITRVAGEPATYGVTVGYKFQ